MIITEEMLTQYAEENPYDAEEGIFNFFETVEPQKEEEEDEF